MWDVCYSELLAHVTGPMQASLMTSLMTSIYYMNSVKGGNANGQQVMGRRRFWKSFCLLFQLNPHCISSVSPRKSSLSFPQSLDSLPWFRGFLHPQYLYGIRAVRQLTLMLHPQANSDLDGGQWDMFTNARITLRFLQCEPHKVKTT